MASWILTKGLQNLRSQVNSRWPNRDKASDGTIGDSAHMAETSSHNADDTAGSRPEWDGDPDSTPEVRAWDMDSDLRESGSSAQMVVDHLRHLPNLDDVIRYMIYNRKIYRASNGWVAETYTGPSAHTEHIHFTGAYTQASDNNTSFDFKLEEVGDMALDTADADVLIGRMVTRMANPADALCTALRAIAWQYDGGGLPNFTTTLQAIDAVGDAQAQAAAALQAVTDLTGKVDRLMTFLNVPVPTLDAKKK